MSTEPPHTYSNTYSNTYSKHLKANIKQETHHEMRLPERDDLFCLLIYAYSEINGYLYMDKRK